jgi:hypothetical protein
MRRSAIAYAALAAALIAGCTSGKNAASSSTTTAPPAQTATGPAPGVTDTGIKIGVVYVDTKSLAAVNLNYNLGDHKAVYTALFDDINKTGGIQGRRVEPVFAAVNPAVPASAEAACVKLTEDDNVFLVTGFFLADAVLCPVSTHATAVVGGGITDQRLQRAKAPWLAWLPDSDAPEQVTREFAKRDALNGRVAVFAAAQDSDVMNKHVLPVLTSLGIKPVATAIMDAPVSDTAAVQSDVKLISERFKSANADTVLIVGPAGANWLTFNDSSFKPKLLFTDIAASRAYATNKSTTNTSLLDGSLSGGGYGPDQARYDEPEMQRCVAVLKGAGIDTPSPALSKNDPSNQQYQAAFQACPDVAVVRAWLNAAGRNLNYGTLAAAVNGLTVHIPGDPTPLKYGPPPARDGNPAAYIFAWDESAKDFVIEK